MDQPQAEFRSRTAQFPEPFPLAEGQGLYGRFVHAKPAEACGPVETSPFEPKVVGNRTIWPIALVKRGDCEFDLKVLVTKNNGENKFSKGYKFLTFDFFFAKSSKKFK